MQEILDTIWYDWLAGVVPLAASMPVQLVYLIGILAFSGIVIGFISVISLVWTLGERKIAGYMQHRYGPNRVGGRFGLLQPVADGLKLFTKEDLMPEGSDKALFTLAPAMVFMGAFLPFVALPFGEHVVLAAMSAGVFFILAFEAIEVIGIIMAGWAPNSKWSLYGGMRLAAQMIAYEIPMGLCILVAVVLTGTLNLIEIVDAQAGLFGVGNWLVWPWVSPFATAAFVLFYVGGLAASKRAPFDLPEAESELVAGFHTEYSGMRFSFFFMAEYAAMYVICAICSVVFLGGWHGPFRDMLAPAEGQWIRGTLHELLGVVYLVGKAWALLFLMVWLRWTLPRVRIDQVIYMCLKVLLPFALFCLLAAAAQTVFLDSNLLQWVLSITGKGGM